MNKKQRISDLKTKKGLGAAVNYSEQIVIPPKKLKAGSIEGKVPIVSDNGRTIRYCDPSVAKERKAYWESKENENTNL